MQEYVLTTARKTAAAAAVVAVLSPQPSEASWTTLMARMASLRIADPHAHAIVQAMQDGVDSGIKSANGILTIAQRTFDQLRTGPTVHVLPPVCRKLLDATTTSTTTPAAASKLASRPRCLWNLSGKVDRSTLSVKTHRLAEMKHAECESCDHCVR